MQACGRAGREEGRWTDGDGERGRGRGKYVQARLCGIDGSFQVRTLLDKPRDNMLSKSTLGLPGKDREGLYKKPSFGKQLFALELRVACCGAHPGPARPITLKGKNKHRLPPVLNIN